MAKLCSVLGCDARHFGRGFCTTHYQRWRKHGDPFVTKRAPNGGGSLNSQGYRQINRTNHSEKEHRVIAEKVLGRRLRQYEEVHHFNEVKSDNRHSNLVICPNRAYHKLLHLRQEARDACGNPSWRRCRHCRQWDDLANLVIAKNGGNRTTTIYHANCRKEYMRHVRN